MRARPKTAGPPCKRGRIERGGGRVKYIRSLQCRGATGHSCSHLAAQDVRAGVYSWHLRRTGRGRGRREGIGAWAPEAQSRGHKARQNKFNSRRQSGAVRPAPSEEGSLKNKGKTRRRRGQYKLRQRVAIHPQCCCQLLAIVIKSSRVRFGIQVKGMLPPLPLATSGARVTSALTRGLVPSPPLLGEL